MISSHARKWQWNHILETKDANHHPRSQLASRRGKDSQSFCNLFFLALPNFSPTFLGVENSSKWHRSALSKLLKTCWNPGTLRFCATWCDFLNAVLLPSKTEQAAWLVRPFSHFLNHRGPPSPMLLAKMSSRHHLGARRAELGSDWCLFRNFECKKARMRQCLGWMFCIYSYFWCIISLLVLFFGCKYTSIDTKKYQKRVKQVCKMKMFLWHFSRCQKKYIKEILLCALLAWLSWAFAWPAHAKPNVACRQMWAAVCFFSYYKR